MKLKAQREIAAELAIRAERAPKRPGRQGRVGAQIYVDRERAEAEEAMLRSYAQCAGLSGRLPRSGSHTAETIGRDSVLLTRDNTGHMKAFENACRHRGAELCGPEIEDGPHIRCPYHGWTYDSEGHLRHVPQRDAFGEMDHGALTLHQLHAVETDGVIWIGEEDNERAMNNVPAGKLAEELQSLALGAYSRYGHRAMTKAVNWKIAVETFLESYHFPALHRTSAAPLFIAHATTVKPFGKHLRLAFARRTIREALAAQETSPRRHFTILYLIFPSTVLVVHGDHAVLCRIWPRWGEINKTDIHIDLYTPEKNREPKLEEWRRQNMALLMRTLEEDFTVAESVQRNAERKGEAVWIHGDQEQALQHWHSSVDQALNANPNPPGDARSSARG